MSFEMDVFALEISAVIKCESIAEDRATVEWLSSRGLALSI